MKSFAIVISTFNGLHKLESLFNALSFQTRKANEIIIVVDGSTDGTVGWLKNQQILPEIIIAEQKNQGRSIVRNNGAKLAQSDILIFLDDDMQPESNCIEQHLLHHQQFPDSILVGAQIDPATNDRTDFQNFKSKLSINWATELKKYEKNPMPGKQTYITAANFSISKKQFELLGGFDERLTDAEDYDLAMRAQQKKIPIFYNHNAFAWHIDNVTCRSYIKRMRQYATSHEALVNLSPDIHADSLKYKKTPPGGIKKIFYSLFCYNGWINSIDKGFWKWLPKAIRYKLYDWVITANGTFFPSIVKLD